MPYTWNVFTRKFDIVGSGGGGDVIESLSKLSLNKGFEYYTHCVEDPLVSYQVNLASGSIVNTDPRSGELAKHPGQWRFRLDNSASARAVLQESSASATRHYVLGCGSWVFETLVNFETLSTASDEYVSIFGLLDGRANDSISNGIYFEYDRTNSVNFIGVTENSSTRTEIDSSVAVPTTSTVWTKLRIEINAAGTSIEFFVNGVSIGTSTTNIYAGDMQQMIRAMKSASTGSQNVMYLDYVYLRNQLTVEV